MRKSVRSPYINYKLLGKHIVKYRNARNMTQEDLAAALGYESASNYGKCERGDRPLNLRTIADICMILHVDLEDMLEGCLIHEPWPNQSRAEEANTAGRFNVLLKGQPQKTVDIAFAICKGLIDEMARKTK